MIKSSIIKSKIKRGNLNLKTTILWDGSNSNYLNNNTILSLFLANGEEIIMHCEESTNNRWILTNIRLIFPNQMEQILLSDLLDVNFDNIESNPNSKMSNNELTLVTVTGNSTLFIEKGTWHLFYEVFKFIIMNIRQKTES